MVPNVSDRLLYRDQVAIIEALRSEVARIGARVHVKLHPGGFTPDPPWLDRFRSATGLTFSKHTPDFSTLLATNDVVVLDFPATCLLQAVTTIRWTCWVFSAHELLAGPRQRPQLLHRPLGDEARPDEPVDK